MENLVALNHNELTEVNGGFNQDAYDAGKWVGDQVGAALVLIGILAML